MRALQADWLVLTVLVAACGSAPVVRGSGTPVCITLPVPQDAGQVSGPRCVPASREACVGGGHVLLWRGKGKCERGVDVSPFRIDKFEVSVEDYARCVQDGPCPQPKTSASDVFVMDEPQETDLCNWPYTGRRSHPMNCIEWQEARTYCEWLGKSLPTQAQFIRAVSDSDQVIYPWGNELPDSTRVNGCDDACQKADFPGELNKIRPGPGISGDDGWPATAPVGSFPKGRSKEGVFDLAGNIWEYTTSRWEYATARGCFQSKNAIVAKGGSWLSGSPERFSREYLESPILGNRYADVGFRCVGVP
jgi:formylglycine-generating enzyme